jgi:hypothetical protein
MTTIRVAFLREPCREIEIDKPYLEIDYGDIAPRILGDETVIGWAEVKDVKTARRK